MILINYKKLKINVYIYSNKRIPSTVAILAQVICIQH